MFHFDQKVILAIDPGTKCGWALRTGDGQLHSGVWDLSQKRGDGGGMRYLRFHKKLLEVHEAHPLDYVLYEKPIGHPKHRSGMMVTAGVVGVLLTFCEAHEITNYEEYPPASIKKLATGKGNSKKEVVLAAARERWPDREIVDDNEADALWLLVLADH